MSLERERRCVRYAEVLHLQRGDDVDSNHDGFVTLIGKCRCDPYWLSGKGRNILGSCYQGRGMSRNMKIDKKLSGVDS